MSYYISKTTNHDFEKAIETVTNLLSEEGFGIISEIDVDQKFKEKLGINFRRYKILGACNPHYAHKALQQEDKIGTMLPCNVIVQEKDSGCEVAAIDPVASMQAVKNPKLEEFAREITNRLKKVIDML